jgi:hypothetical protein
MRVFGQCSRMRRTNRRRWALTSLPSGVFPGRRMVKHAMAGVSVIDMDRQKAPFIIMGMEQRQLLMAVHGIGGIVDVERDRLGRTWRARQILSSLREWTRQPISSDSRRLYHARQRIAALR